MTADEQRDARVEFDYRPPTTAAAVAFGASLVAVVALAAASLLASVGAGLGAVVLAAGLVRGTHGLVTAGTGVTFGALVAGAWSGGTVAAVLVAAVGMLVAYDAGRYAVQLGRQIGQGETSEVERHHVGVTVGVSVAGVAVGAAVYYVTPELRPNVALFALLIAVALFVSGLVLLDDGTDEVG